MAEPLTASISMPEEVREAYLEVRLVGTKETRKMGERSRRMVMLLVWKNREST